MGFLSAVDVVLLPSIEGVLAPLSNAVVVPR
jgi:hypothetical protein